MFVQALQAHGFIGCLDKLRAMRSAGEIVKHVFQRMDALPAELPTYKGVNSC